MNDLTDREYNRLLLSGQDLMILLYEPGDPATILVETKLETIEKMHGKTFSIFRVDVTREREIFHVLSPSELPEIIFIKDTKVHKRLHGFPTENQILDITR